jgi:fumarate reductase subunit C
MNLTRKFLVREAVGTYSIFNNLILKSGLFEVKTKTEKWTYRLNFKRLKLNKSIAITESEKEGL